MESMDSAMRNLDQRTAKPAAAEIANKNGKPEVFPPRLAFTIQETAHVLGGVCPKDRAASHSQEPPAPIAGVALSVDSNLGSRTLFIRHNADGKWAR